MPLTVEQILADLGVTLDPAKADAAKGWNGKLSTLETDATQKLADAQKQLEDAQALQRVIDENIAANGLTEANMAQLRANNAALTAALAEVKRAGFTGISIPDLPNPQPAKDPVDDLKNLIVRGFTNIQQTQNVSARYQRVTGKPLPDDPSVLADEAAARRMDVMAYAEQKYGLTALEQKANTDRLQKERDDYAALKVKEYQDAHPVTTGHPELQPGVPSNYPAIPAPRDGKSLREFAGMSDRQKIADSMKRVTEAVASRASA